MRLTRNVLVEWVQDQLGEERLAHRLVVLELVAVQVGRAEIAEWRQTQKPMSALLP